MDKLLPATSSSIAAAAAAAAAAAGVYKQTRASIRRREKREKCLAQILACYARRYYVYLVILLDRPITPHFYRHPPIVSSHQQ